MLSGSIPCLAYPANHTTCTPSTQPPTRRGSHYTHEVEYLREGVSGWADRPPPHNPPPPPASLSRPAFQPTSAITGEGYQNMSHTYHGTCICSCSGSHTLSQCGLRSQPAQPIHQPSTNRHVERSGPKTGSRGKSESGGGRLNDCAGK
jgi:hypothetical protein